MRKVISAEEAYRLSNKKKRTKEELSKLYTFYKYILDFSKEFSFGKVEQFSEVCLHTIKKEYKKNYE